jgi:hypothetical protein
MVGRSRCYSSPCRHCRSFYTWIFQHTRGSLLIAVLFHAASNLWGVALLPPVGEDATPAVLRTSATWLLALMVIGANRRAWTARRPDVSDSL